MGCDVPACGAACSQLEHGRLAQRGSPQARCLTRTGCGRLPCPRTAPSRVSCSPQMTSAVFALAIHSGPVNRLLALIVRFSQSTPGSSGSSLAHTVGESFAFVCRSLLMSSTLSFAPSAKGSFAIFSRSLPGSSATSLHGWVVRCRLQIDARNFHQLVATLCNRVARFFSPGRFLPLPPAPWRTLWKGHLLQSPTPSS